MRQFCASEAPKQPGITGPNRLISCLDAPLRAYIADPRDPDLGADGLRLNGFPMRFPGSRMGGAAIAFLGLILLEGTV